MNNFTSTAFIQDVVSFADALINKYGFHSARTTVVLEGYNHDFADFAQALATFSPVEIKSILFQLTDANTHALGEKMVEKLLKQLEDMLEASDFLFLVKDPKLAHLYRYF